MSGPESLDSFDTLIAGLERPAAFPHPVERVERVETHISVVLLAGDFAYKLKKPLALGFLDFSTLEKRRFYCEEELRLNRRLAADLYLGVVPICGDPRAPTIAGPGEVLDYAVQMRRFPQASLLDRRLLPDGLPVGLLERLAQQVVAFHASVPVADAQSQFGTPQAVLGPMLDNLRLLRSLHTDAECLARIARLERWTLDQFAALIPVITQRRAEGRVRECHGDLHLGNIALVDTDLIIFDAIEFNPQLRWIDTASEIAFLIMDLEQAGQVAEARRFLNRYLELGGDYGALAVLDFYKVYRALVRAKVLAIRWGQQGLSAAARAAAKRDCARYLALAEGYLSQRTARLLILCGLPGSGKSSLARGLREQLPVIHVRSDIERKRLFGLDEQARTLTAIDGGIYFPIATDWTYERLYQLADQILGSGYGVLVDATFIARERRQRFRELAARHDAALTILALDAPLEVLRERVSRRLASGEDPSEASVSVLERQHAKRQCLDEAERACAILVDTTQSLSIDGLLERLGEPPAAARAE